MNLKKYIWLAALPIAFTACQEDVLVENSIANGNGVFTIRGTMDTGKSDSRAQILLNGNNTTEEAFHWNEGDKFTLFQNTDENHDWSALKWTTHEFEIDGSYSDDSPTGTADFNVVQSANILIEGNNFRAIYPNLSVTNEAMNVVRMELDQTLTDNSAASWTEYFKKNMFMTAEGTISSMSTATANFEQLCGLIRITYQNSTEKDKAIKGIFLNESWGYAREYFINTGEIQVEDDKEDFGLTFTGEEGAVVPAGTSTDFYILFFPSISGTSLRHITIEDVDGNTVTTPDYEWTNGVELPFELESGKCYWMNVTDSELGLLWTNNRRYLEVNNQEELEKALKVEPYYYNGNEISSEIYFNNDITISKPLIVNKPVSLNLNGYKLKVADNCEPTTKDESIAVIYANSSLDFRNGTIEGPTSTACHESLIYGSSIRLDQVEINTGKIMNAISLERGSMYLSLWGKSSIITPEGKGCAFDLNDMYRTEIHVGIDGEIRGNFNLTANANVNTTEYGKRFEVSIGSGKLTGNLILSPSAELLSLITISEGVVTEGEGWSDIIKTDMSKTIQSLWTENGEVNFDALSINENMTFEMDDTKEFYRFRISTLTGTGTITFRYTGENVKELNLNCDSYLSNSVKFKFEGNIQKSIQVRTGNLDLVNAVTTLDDDIRIILANDIQLDKQIVIDGFYKETVYDEYNKRVYLSNVTVDLNGYNITSNLDVPAFWIKGGCFELENYQRNVPLSSITTKNHVIQIGAPGEANERIDVYVRDNIKVKSTEGYGFYCNAGSESTTYKSINALSVADEFVGQLGNIGYGIGYEKDDENCSVSIDSRN